MALGGVNVLFAAFVAIQFRYFFGGADVVAFTPGLTYAEYARRGFFELVWVSGLALPLLLFLDALRKKGDRKTEVFFRVLAAATIILLFVVMLSAVQRMRLYVDEFGVTERDCIRRSLWRGSRSFSSGSARQSFVARADDSSSARWSRASRPSPRSMC